MHLLSFLRDSQPRWRMADARRNNRHLLKSQFVLSHSEFRGLDLELLPTYSIRTCLAYRLGERAHTHFHKKVYLYLVHPLLQCNDCIVVRADLWAKAKEVR